MGLGPQPGPIVLFLPNMKEVMQLALVPVSQSHHIELNVGNIFAIGLLSLLFYGAATWSSNVLARTEIPVVSQVAVGAQMFLHAA